MRLKLYSLGILLLLLTGCGETFTALSDVGGAAGGAAVGSSLSDGKMLPTFLGAAGGVGASKILQHKVVEARKVAYQEGYNDAMSQNVKQQYWIMQNQHKSEQNQNATRMETIPVVIPEQEIDGEIQKERIEYIRVER